MTSVIEADCVATCGAALVRDQIENIVFRVLSIVLKVPIINAAGGVISCSDMPSIQATCFVLAPKASADMIAG